MPHILRSDTSKGYGSAARTSRVQRMSIPRASFLGIPPEVRMQIYQLVLTKMVLKVWYHLRPRFQLHMSCFATAIVRTCLQIRIEATPVLFENLESSFDYYDSTNNVDTMQQIHPTIQEHVLPYIRKLSFTTSIPSRIVPYHRFRHWLPCLKMVDVGSIMGRISCSSRSQMYDAAVNKNKMYPPVSNEEPTAVSSCNRFLMCTTLSRCHAWGHAKAPVPTSSWSWLRDLLEDKSRKFSVIGRIHGTLKGNGVSPLRIILTFDLDTLAVIGPHVVPWFHDELKTVRDARVFFFGEQGCVLEGETVEQAQLEGQKLLSELLDAS